MQPTVHTAKGRRAATSVGLVVLVASALVGSNLFGLRDQLFGSAVPEPTVAAGSRDASAAATAPTTAAAPTRLRSQPWWQAVTTLEGTGPMTSNPFTIEDSAVQWRVKSTCQSGRLVVQAAQRPKPLVDGACPGDEVGFSTKTGVVKVQVTADGPWTLKVEQQVDVPLVEPPLATMTAPGASVVAKGTFYKIDHPASGTLSVYRQADGSHALRLEDFFVSPNSELEVRLSPLKAPKTTDEFDDADSEVVTKLDVTTGSLNFTMPATIDPAKFGSVVIWCAAVHSAYAAATLGPPQ